MIKGYGRKRRERRRKEGRGERRREEEEEKRGEKRRKERKEEGPKYPNTHSSDVVPRSPCWSKSTCAVHPAPFPHPGNSKSNFISGNLLFFSIWSLLEKEGRKEGRMAIYYLKKKPCAVRPLEVFACITMGQPTGGRGCKWQGGRKWWRRNLSSDATLISTIR